MLKFYHLTIIAVHNALNAHEMGTTAPHVLQRSGSHSRPARKHGQVFLSPVHDQEASEQH
eukprot:m.183029 g.183029  ORF g.183029 m.183029 type:complete len:60 (-) comp18475_c0_seq9:18-197(-)